MSAETQELEAIVRAVIERLLSTSAPISATAASVTRPAVPSPPEDDAIGLSDRVITLASLEHFTNETRRVIVRPNAIVTPSARDELAKRGIEVVRGETVPTKVKSQTSSIVWTIGETAWDAGGIMNSLAPQMSGAREIVAETFPMRVAELAHEVADHDRLGIVFTEATAVALCIANRQAGVRAVHVHDLHELQSLETTLAPNVLVIDPREQGTFAMRRLVEQLIRQGDRPCPAALDTKLGAGPACSCQH
jgi:hypothetical protein